MRQADPSPPSGSGRGPRRSWSHAAYNPDDSKSNGKGGSASLAADREGR